MKKCCITDISSKNGGGYSNSTRATKYNPTGKRRRKANIQKTRIFVPELGKSICLNVTPRGLRTMQKNGIHKTLKKANILK